jgi:nicotinamidase/pyrazinamidase
MANAVLIIDMVRGFLEPGHSLYCGDQSRQLIPRVHELAERELRRGSKLLYLCDHHTPDDLEFKLFPPHCIIGTEETEVVEELRDLPGEVIPKNRYSAFHNTTLDDHLMHIGPERLIMAGVCTDICVLYTAADARNRDFEVEVPADCVTSFDSNGHDFALDHMRRILGVQVVGAPPAARER